MQYENMKTHTKYEFFDAKLSFLLIKMQYTVYFTGISFANTIQPLSSEKHVFRGEKVTLSCSYSGDVNNLQWYRQYSGSRPECLILITEYSEPDLSLRLSAKASKDLKQVNLTISSAEETDSALTTAPWCPQ